MNALHLKDLADKTRRGLRGRVEAGKSGGGNSYGYDVVRRIDASGEPVRGERGVNPQQAAIVRPLGAGNPRWRARTVRDRMAQLEARKELLEAQLAQGADAKGVPHPNMARIYREQVADLRNALSDEGCRIEAAQMLRTLIDRIDLTPDDRGGGLSVSLHGHLAGILGLAARAQGPLESSGPSVQQ